ncbi:MAG: alpha/beta fold hydrolase [Amnibacterium sp.]
MSSPVRGELPDAVALDERLPDIDWSEPPEGSERWTFEAPSGPLAALRAGDPRGPRVVLVPGVTGSKEDFHFQFPQLARAGYLVESFDLAGQYESWPAGPERLSPPRRAYDYPLFVDDLTAFLTAGRRPAHLLGYSFAGVVAQLVAAGRPELVASLTLLSAPPLAGQVFRGVRGYGALSRVVPARGITAAMRWALLLNVQRVPPGRQRFVERRLEVTRPDAFRQMIGLMRHVPDVTADLRGAAFPIALAVGKGDLWPLETHRRFASRLGATISVYRTGHSPCETAPHQLSSDLMALFTKASTPDSRTP